MESLKGQRIFLSYATTDQRRVVMLSKWLLDQGFDLSSGRVSGTDEGRELIHKANFFLACLTQDSLDGRGKIEKKIKRELDLLWKGIDNEAFLIPVRLEACLIPETLKAFPNVDVFTSEDFPALLDQMLPVIERRRKLREAFPDLVTATKSLPSDTEQISDLSVEGPSDPLSVYSWHVDLLRLLAGEREDSLERLGDVEEYVEVNIAEADDPSGARVAFETALEKVIQTWQPSVLDEHINQDYVLELLTQYNIEVGREKVIAFATILKRALDREPVEDAERLKELYLSALVTLENYHSNPPKPGTRRSTAYQTYIDLLKEDLSSPDFGGYAYKRLVELKEKSPSRDEIKNLINLNSKSLLPIIQLVLDPVRESSTFKSLVEIYTLCLDARVDAAERFEREFETAIKSCGGEFRRDDDGPGIKINKMYFPIHKDFVSKYHTMIQFRNTLEGFKKEHEIKQEAAMAGSN